MGWVRGIVFILNSNGRDCVGKKTSSRIEKKKKMVDRIVWIGWMNEIRKGTRSKRMHSNGLKIVGVALT